MTSTPPLRSSISAAAHEGGRLGLPFSLLLIWLFFEFGRPPNPFAIPLLISTALFFFWITRPDKQWTRYSVWWLVLLGVMVVGTLLSANTYAAYWSTRNMAVRFLCICLPLQAFTTSVRKVRLWIYSFIAVATYVAWWAAWHGGYGPSGSAGGQDENYVATLMGMGVGLAYFAFLADKRLIPRILLVLSIVVFVAAIALGANPSRGGFLGLCAVALYCLSRSPRKLTGAGVIAAIGLSLVIFAGPRFWKEIATSGDYQDGTGDVRIELWKSGLRMWQAHPLFGVGSDNFRWVINDYETAEQYAKFGRALGGTMVPHSLWVEMLAEVGTLGAIATLLLLFHTWKGLSRLRSEIAGSGPQVGTELTQLACYVDATRAGIIAVLVNGTFLSLYNYSHLWLLLALGSALPFVYRKKRGVPASLRVAVPFQTVEARPGERVARAAAIRRRDCIPRSTM
jgi:O-antigen ligase